MAQALRAAKVNSVNISLDTLDREAYAATTGRDFLPQVLEGIDGAISAGFPLIKLNCVLMRGRNDDQLVPLVEFAAERDLMLRFIELMPVSHSDVLDESNFLPVAEARRRLEERFGPLIPDPTFRTNGPSSYYKVAGRANNVPLVEIPISFSASIAGRRSNKLRTSRRVRGSPPVIRTFDTPSSVAIRIRRSVSS